MKNVSCLPCPLGPHYKPVSLYFRENRGKQGTEGLEIYLWQIVSMTIKQGRGHFNLLQFLLLVSYRLGREEGRGNLLLLGREHTHLCPHRSSCWPPPRLLRHPLKRILFRAFVETKNVQKSCRCLSCDLGVNEQVFN